MHLFTVIVIIVAHYVHVLLNCERCNEKVSECPGLELRVRVRIDKIPCLYTCISSQLATPLLQVGGAPALPNFGGCLLFIHTPFDTELPNLT